MNRLALLFAAAIFALASTSTHTLAATPDAPAALPDVEGVWAQKLVTTAVSKVLGANLDAEADKLPRKKSDPRVIDGDKDGHPGMTVRVSGLIDGELYLLQKSWDRLWGKMLGDGRIVGRIKWRTEQVVLDSTSRLLGDPPESKPHPDPKQSYFRMKRVTAQTSCADIVKTQKELF
ncbi:hypothetical protein FIV42_26395 [Persicimonas caeni]|uniref:Uncharacterized protein n=1 Tax=Persicimonas caeni TaxID=2292766 RepID=A0A4Y6Q0T6_PERCE|nr:hypothetical protein [Persicimonas caeni]QDG54143.1 hypothetical protein FIV42_26395 [Persicimonas caeni]QED35364.1 hypothetical protein FRD00_26390 [Persicimonas caeni]